MVKAFFQARIGRAGALAIWLSVLVSIRAEPVADGVRAHIEFLADDLLAGRATGSPGFALAANYVAAQFRAAGLEPAGDRGGWQQAIQFLEATRVPEGAVARLERRGVTETLKYGEDYVADPVWFGEKAEVTAPLLFVGYGVHAPDSGYDDFAGVDLTGKIAVVLSGAPPTLPHDERAYYTKTTVKYAELARCHAVGVVTVLTPEDDARVPWAIRINGTRFSAMRLVDETSRPLDVFPELKVGITLQREAAARWLGGGPRPLAEIFAAAKLGKPQAFALPGTATLVAQSTFRRVASANVLGRLAGSDPKLREEVVVVTAHLDHIGIGPAINGDNIYNGRYDNATGTAILIEAARLLAGGPRPRRTVLFAALTGEEKGLLGGVHLARHPVVPREKVAANVNVDMPMFLGAARDVIAWGAEHSTLGKVVERVGRAHGLALGPDPAPEEVIFVRSDQYPFVEAGVPAIYLDPGETPVDPAMKLHELNAEFRRLHYHRPSDDLSLPFDHAAAAHFTRFIADVVRGVTDEPQRPQWNKGDFFGARFAP